jgi:plasmid stabilization system protein ParE
VSKPIRTEEEADQELAEALARYEEQRRGLGHDFLAAVDAVLQRISHFPKTGAAVPQAPPHLGARRVPVNRFPYHIVYLETPDAIRVLAFAHNRRRPFYWLSRST